MTSPIVIAGTLAEQEYLAQRQKHPASIDAVARWCGRTPSHGWLFDETGTTLTAAFGAVNLSEAGTIGTKGAATPYPNLLASESADGGTGRWEAANSTVLNDDGATSFAHLFHGRVLATSSGANRAFFGKYDSVGSIWWIAILVSTSGNFQFYVNDGVTQVAVAVAVPHFSLDSWFWCAVDRTANLLRVHTRRGGATIDISTVGSLANATAAPFRILTSAQASVYHQHLAHYRFEGADAEGDPTETMRRIQRYLG